MCAVGKHQALNPTSQRLLAASKLALSKEDKGKPKKSTPKAKAKGKAKAKTKAAAATRKKTKGKVASTAHPDSVTYMTAKKNFLDKQTDMPHKDKEKAWKESQEYQEVIATLDPRQVTWHRG
ncbi:unnamed protein product [Symbiodinium sp. CCMP2592]|nr:unnamed protein product [Symbiodinium sp. CCMP2592]